MIHVYRVMAAIGASLMLASFATGLWAADWRGLHVALSVGTVAVVLGIHTIVYAYFFATVKQAETASRALGLPAWPTAQASRNRRRASPFILLGAVSVVLTAGLGLRSPQAGAWPWHLAASSFALGFGAVATLIVYAGLIAHRKLLAEMQELADEGREAAESADAAEVSS